METTATPTELDYAWAAGFIDGEGCLRIAYQKGVESYCAHLEVGQTREGPLLELQRILGGRVRHHSKATEKHATVYRWQIIGANAITAVRHILPYLKLKAPQAQLFLEFQTGVPPRGGRKPKPTVEELTRRQSLKEQIAFFNKKGPQ